MAALQQQGQAGELTDAQLDQVTGGLTGFEILAIGMLLGIQGAVWGSVISDAIDTISGWFD